MNEVITLNQDSKSILYLTKKDKKLKLAFDLIGPVTYQLYSDPMRS